MGVIEFELTPEEKDFQDRVLKEESILRKNPNQSLGTQIEKQASDRPDNTALFYDNNSWTWNSVNAECNRVANFFQKFGLKNGVVTPSIMYPLSLVCCTDSPISYIEKS